MVSAYVLPVNYCEASLISQQQFASRACDVSTVLPRPGKLGSMGTAELAPNTQPCQLVEPELSAFLTKLGIAVDERGDSTSLPMRAYKLRKALESNPKMIPSE